MNYCTGRQLLVVTIKNMILLNHELTVVFAITIVIKHWNVKGKTQDYQKEADYYTINN